MFAWSSIIDGIEINFDFLSFANDVTGIGDWEALKGGEIRRSQLQRLIDGVLNLRFSKRRAVILRIGMVQLAHASLSFGPLPLLTQRSPR